MARSHPSARRDSPCARRSAAATGEQTIDQALTPRRSGTATGCRLRSPLPLAVTPGTASMARSVLKTSWCSGWWSSCSRCRWRRRSCTRNSSRRSRSAGWRRRRRCRRRRLARVVAHQPVAVGAHQHDPAAVVAVRTVTRDLFPWTMLLCERTSTIPRPPSWLTLPRMVARSESSREMPGRVSGPVELVMGRVRCADGRLVGTLQPYAVQASTLTMTLRLASVSRMLSRTRRHRRSRRRGGGAPACPRLTGGSRGCGCPRCRGRPWKRTCCRGGS